MDSTQTYIRLRQVHTRNSRKGGGHSRDLSVRSWNMHINTNSSIEDNANLTRTEAQVAFDLYTDAAAHIQKQLDYLEGVLKPKAPSRSRKKKGQ